MFKNELKKLNDLKKKKKKIVLCHGVFDILHAGHIKYFEQAKKYGDVLVVSVTSDRYVNKGSHRPIFILKNRISILKNIKIIDFVIESDFPTAEYIINKVKPNFYCKGPDYLNKLELDKNLKKEIIILNKNKGKFISVKHKKYSSSKIINEANLEQKNSKLSNYISMIKSKYDSNKIISSFRKLKNCKSLVLGELIIDKYNFADAIGRSGKDSIMVFQLKNEQVFLGGSGYIANLASEISKKTSYIFHVGEKNNEYQFIKKKLSSKIIYEKLNKSDSPTITKLRYVDFYRNNKIAGFYDINDDPLTLSEEKKFIKKLNKYIKNVDLVILADYGHGEISGSVISNLQKKHKKLFVNTQLNSFNYGSHNLSKFKKVNTLCVNESELRFELRDKKSDIESLVNKFKKQVIFDNIIITQGKNGSTLFTRNNQKFNCPAFDLKPVDAVGSGDTLFTFISVSLASGINPELALFFASVAAAFSTQKIGNDYKLNYSEFEKNIKKIIL